MQHNSFFVNDV